MTESPVARPSPSSHSPSVAPSAAVSNPRQIPLTCAGHTRPVVQLQFSRILDDGNYLLISACKDGSPMLRIGDTGDWIGTFAGHKGAVWSSRLNEDASRAVTGSADFTVKVWDTYTGGVQYTFPHRHVVRSVDISPDGRWVVSGGNEKVLRVFDLDQIPPNHPDDPSKKPVAPTVGVMETKAHDSAIKTVIWDPWRGVILSAADEKNVKVWSAESLELVHTMETLDPVSSLSLSDDGEVIEAAAGKSVYFWSAQTYELACRVDTPYELSCVALHPMRDRFVCGSRTDTWVRVFRFPTGEEMEVYRGHHGPVHAVAYSPDGELYATGSEDGTIRLWQTVPGTEYGLWRTQPVVEALPTQEFLPPATTAYSDPNYAMSTFMGNVLTPEEQELLRLQAEEDFRKQQMLAEQQALRAVASSSALESAETSSPESSEPAIAPPPTGSRYQPPGKRHPLATSVYP